MDYTGGQQPVSSTKRPTRVTHCRGCQIGYVANTGRDQLVSRLQKNQKLQKCLANPTDEQHAGWERAGEGLRHDGAARRPREDLNLPRGIHHGVAAHVAI